MSKLVWLNESGEALLIEVLRAIHERLWRTVIMRHETCLT
jgi:hypothetical protein